MARKSAGKPAGGASVPASRESATVKETAREDTRPTKLKASSLLDTRVIYCGDNLEQLARLPAACVDLIYIDPPFNSNRSYEVFFSHPDIYNWRCTPSTPGATPIVEQATASRHTFTGLAAGVNHTVDASASGTAGQSDWSSPASLFADQNSNLESFISRACRINTARFGFEPI